MTCPSVRSCAIIPTYNLRDTQGNELRKLGTFHTKESLLGGPQNNADIHRRSFCVLSPTLSFRHVPRPPKGFGGRTFSFPFLSPLSQGKSGVSEMFGSTLLCGYVLAGLFSTIGAIFDFFVRFIVGGCPGALVAVGFGMFSSFVFSIALGCSKLWESLDSIICVGILFFVGGLGVGTLSTYRVNSISDWFAAVALWGLLSGCLYPLGEFIWNWFKDL